MQDGLEVVHASAFGFRDWGFGFHAPKVEVINFWEVSGFRFEVLGFMVGPCLSGRPPESARICQMWRYITLGFGIRGLGLRACGLGFRVQGLGLRMMNLIWEGSSTISTVT